MNKASAIVISAVATLSLLGGMIGIVRRTAPGPAKVQTVYVQSAAAGAPAAPAAAAPRSESEED